MQRIRIEEIRNDEWFKKGYVPVKLAESEDVNLDDVNAVFNDAEVGESKFAAAFCIIVSSSDILRYDCNLYFFFLGFGPVVRNWL